MTRPTICALILFFIFQLTAPPGFARNTSITIGLSFAEFEIERWPIEEAIMRTLAITQGAELISQVANHDAELQNKQIANMIALGADVIIIIAEDGTTAAKAVSSASAKGIPCIAYDRLIKSNRLAAYVSFDNIEVGRAQAREILTRVNKGNFVLLGGSPTDNNAALFRKGQMEVLQPFIDSGAIRIVADPWVDDWSPTQASREMADILEAQDNGIAAVVASNDGIALGALQALRAHGLAGRVPISGQDATTAGCKAIIEDELTMTVFKDVRRLAPMAIAMALALAKKEKIDTLQSIPFTELAMDPTLRGSVPCRFLEVTTITKANLYSEIIKNGFHKYDDIYRDIPENLRPPRP